MYTLTVVIHLIVCFLMIAAILLQAGKGAEIGAAFGGSSQTVFGSRGPGTFLSKVTVGAAIVFMLSSLSLALLSKSEKTGSSVIDFSAPARTNSTTKEVETLPVAEPAKATSESTPTTPPPSDVSTDKTPTPATTKE